MFSQLVTAALEYCVENASAAITRKSWNECHHRLIMSAMDARKG